MKRLVSDSLVYGLSGVLSKLINIILLPLYANMFTVSDYGILAVLALFTSMLGQIVMLQLDSGAFRFILDKNNTDEIIITLSSWFWTQLSLSLLTLIVSYIFSRKISLILFGSQNYQLMIIVSILAFPFNTIEYVCTTYWRINRSKWHIVITNVIGLLALLILNYYFVKYLKLGIISLAWSALIVCLLKAIFLLPFILKFINPNHFNLVRLKGMLKYCSPFIPAGISLCTLTLIDRIILEKYTSPTEVGIYQMSNNVAGLIMLPIAAFIQAWSPYVFSILDDPGHKIIISKGTLFFVISMSILAFFCTLFNSEILFLLTSPAYYMSSSFVPILLFSNILMGLYQISGTGSAIAMKTKYVMWVTIISAVFNVLLNFILVPLYQIAGASLATLISYSIIPVYLFYCSQKVYKIPYNFGIMSLTFIALFMLSMLSNKFFDNFYFDIRFLSAKMAVCAIICCGFFYFYKEIKCYFAQS